MRVATVVQNQSTESVPAELRAQGPPLRGETGEVGGIREVPSLHPAYLPSPGLDRVGGFGNHP